MEVQPSVLMHVPIPPPLLPRGGCPNPACDSKETMITVIGMSVVAERSPTRAMADAIHYRGPRADGFTSSRPEDVMREFPKLDVDDMYRFSKGVGAWTPFVPHANNDVAKLELRHMLDSVLKMFDALPVYEQTWTTLKAAVMNTFTDTSRLDTIRAQTPVTPTLDLSTVASLLNRRWGPPSMLWVAKHASMNWSCAPERARAAAVVNALLAACVRKTPDVLDTETTDETLLNSEGIHFESAGFTMVRDDRTTLPIGPGTQFHHCVACGWDQIATAEAAEAAAETVTTATTGIDLYPEAYAKLSDDGVVTCTGSEEWGGAGPPVDFQTNVTDLVGDDTAFAALRTDGVVTVWGYDPTTVIPIEDLYDRADGLTVTGLKCSGSVHIYVVMSDGSRILLHKVSE